MNERQDLAMRSRWGFSTHGGSACIPIARHFTCRLVPLVLRVDNLNLTHASARSRCLRVGHCTSRCRKINTSSLANKETPKKWHPKQKQFAYLSSYFCITKLNQINNQRIVYPYLKNVKTVQGATSKCNNKFGVPFCFQFQCLIAIKSQSSFDSLWFSICDKNKMCKNRFEISRRFAKWAIKITNERFHLLVSFKIKSSAVSTTSNQCAISIFNQLIVNCIRFDRIFM